MGRRCFLVALFSLTAIGAAAAVVGQETTAERLPNIVIIFCDDLGYADIGPFGCTRYATPHLDRMAREGRKFTDFAASSAVCSASRASLLTGCYSPRVGIHGALAPQSRIGIHTDEMTLAELCRQQGYATACFGKWHLGHQRQFLPLQHGFDEFFGIPYSNDMWPLHPDFADLPNDDQRRKRGYPDLPLIEGNEVVLAAVGGQDQEQFTTQFTERAVRFIRNHRDRPFFLYVPHPMAHVPLFVSDKFRGKSGAGLFGDVVMELDWSVGEIIRAIDDAQLGEHTLIIFSSDNGPWLSYGGHAGSAHPLREGKGTMWEGGYRVPTLMRWTGKIPPGTVCDELASTIDLFPTVAALIEGKLPDHPIDGRDIRRLMLDESPLPSPHTEFACYYAGGLIAVRDRQYKLVFPHQYRSLGNEPPRDDGRPVPYVTRTTAEALYDLKNDIGESQDVAALYPDVVARLRNSAARYREALGDTLTGSTGRELRPAGTVE